MKKLYYTDGVERLPIYVRCPICNSQLYDTCSIEHGYCDTCKKIIRHTLINPGIVHRILRPMDKHDQGD